MRERDEAAQTEDERFLDVAECGGPYALVKRVTSTLVHACEKLALTAGHTGNPEGRNAVVRMIGDYRRLRIAAAEMLEKRYRDGECDAVALHRFETELLEIIEGMEVSDE